MGIYWQARLLLARYMLSIKLEDCVKFSLQMLMIFLLIFPACNRNPRNTQAASEDESNAADQMRVDTTDRNDYIAAVEPRLAGLDLRIDKLDQQANAMSGPAKEKFKKAIDGLRDQRKSLDSKLDDLKKADINSWLPLSWEVNSGLANLESSYTQVQNMMSQY
jgi:hypothetical protein